MFSMIPRRMYLKNYFDVYDKNLIFVTRGKVLDNVETEVGSNGTKVSCITDLHGWSNYEDGNEDYKDDRFTFFKRKGRNPKVTYHKKDNMTVIKIGLSNKVGSEMQNLGNANRPKTMFPMFENMIGKAKRIMGIPNYSEKTVLNSDSFGYESSNIKMMFKWTFKVVFAIAISIVFVFGYRVMIWLKQFTPDDVHKTGCANLPIILFCKGQLTHDVFGKITKEGTILSFGPNPEMVINKRNGEERTTYISMEKLEKTYYNILNMTMVKVNHPTSHTALIGDNDTSTVDNCSDGYTNPKETSQTSTNKLAFIASPKELHGTVTIGVEPSGNTVECHTDVNGWTNTKHVYKRFKAHIGILKQEN